MIRGWDFEPYGIGRGRGCRVTPWVVDQWSLNKTQGKEAGRPGELPWLAIPLAYCHTQVPQAAPGPSHWSPLYTSPDEIQGLLFVYASRMRPFPVQKVPLVGAAEVLCLAAEVAL